MKKEDASEKDRGGKNKSGKRIPDRGALKKSAYNGKRTLRGSIGILVFLLGIFSAAWLQQNKQAPDSSGNAPENIYAVKESGEISRQNGSGTMEVHFIDVGQADATLIQCEGAAMLIDAGEDSSGAAIQDYLQKQGVTRLDYLVLTHPDADHIGGAPAIITKFDINQVFLSNFEKDNQTYRELIQALDDRGLQRSTPQVGSTWTLGSASFTILGPNDTYQDPNNASVALLVQHGSKGFLFTGDAEEEAELDILANGLPVRADVYKAGHHGSKTASCRELIDAAAPEFAVISCGEDNSYGHPHAETLNTFRMKGIRLYRTDEQGSVVAVSDGKEITWNCAPTESWKAGEPR